MIIIQTYDTTFSAHEVFLEYPQSNTHENSGFRISI